VGGMSSGPSIECSLSDTVAYLTVESEGCQLWTATAGSIGWVGGVASTLAPNRKLIISPLIPGSSTEFELRARCISFLENPIEIGFRYQASSTGIGSVDLGDRFPEPIEELLPLSNDRFLGVGRRWAYPIARGSDGKWQVGTPGI